MSKKFYVYETEIRVAADGVPILGICSHALPASYRIDPDVPQGYKTKIITAYHMINGDLLGEYGGFVYYKMFNSIRRKSEDGHTEYFRFGKFKILKKKNELVLVEAVPTGLADWCDIPVEGRKRL